MGHQRLGYIPKAQKWLAVVAALIDGEGLARDDVGKIAAKTLDAASPALKHALEDIGLRYTFYLLTQLVLAARTDNWQAHLADAGITLTETSSIFDLTSQVQYAIDDYLTMHGQPTDISEMAQRAVGESLSLLATDNSVTLFGQGGAELQTAIRDLSTPRGFSRLGQVFFGRFTSQFLNFYLSRVTATAVGNTRIPNVEAVSRFNDSLKLHCEQSAKIVHDFCGQWYSKTEYQEGINLRNTTRFMAIALGKLSRELEKQRAEL